jgi:hypothetical protein
MTQPAERKCTRPCGAAPAGAPLSAPRRRPRLARGMHAPLAPGGPSLCRRGCPLARLPGTRAGLALELSVRYACLRSCRLHVSAAADTPSPPGCQALLPGPQGAVKEGTGFARAGSGTPARELTVCKPER